MYPVIEVSHADEQTRIGSIREWPHLPRANERIWVGETKVVVQRVIHAPDENRVTVEALPVEDGHIGG